jgi:tRNA threonylcarbamoyladenosine biosynthesis protein TsaE
MAKSKKMVYIAKSAAQTKKLGVLLAKTILANGPGKRALVLALAGDLGAGKTQFVQGFAKGLGIKETVGSPTFVILKRYLLAVGKFKTFKTFYHIDCYRLKSGKDLGPLGISGILANPENIVAVEWPDVINNLPAQDIIFLSFEIFGLNNRKISITASK